MNISEFLTISSSIVPDRVATAFEDKECSYQALLNRANRLANGLSELGVESGDRVAILQVNCNQHVETVFATLKIDAVYVPLNFRSKADEIAFMLNDCEPKALIVGGRYSKMIKSIMPKIKATKIFISLEEPVEDWTAYQDLVSQSQDTELFPANDDDDLAVLMFTAGTTGSPKGVMLSHGSFSSYVLNNVSPADPDSEDESNLLTVPLYHVAGLQAVMAAIYGGRTIIIERQFEAKDWMELVQKYRANRAMIVPTMLKQLMDHPDFKQYDLSSLQVITYGAAPMPLPVIKRALKEFPNTKFINAFGQTETAATITMLPPEDHVLTGDPATIEKKLNRLTSIGKPLDDVEVTIVNEDGKKVKTGEIGEIAARGDRLMKGYWNQEAATKEAIRGGWLYTGDLGYMDNDGYIFLSGRSKDFIKRGGEMIAPEEVEQLLMLHPAVDEAAIIGVPDDDWGERVRAITVLKPGKNATEEELIEHCREKLASFKKPESVVFVDQLPRNPMGKVLKRQLRQEYNSPIEANEKK